MDRDIKFPVMFVSSSLTSGRELGYYGRGELHLLKDVIGLYGKKAWPKSKKGMYLAPFVAAGFLIRQPGVGLAAWFVLMLFIAHTEEHYSFKVSSIERLKVKGKEVSFYAPSDNSTKLEKVILKLKSRDQANEFIAALSS